MEFRFDPVLNVRLDGDLGPAKVRISPEEVVALDLADEQRMREWYEFCDRFWGPAPESEYLYACGAGISSFHIDPNGLLSLCMMAAPPWLRLAPGYLSGGLALNFCARRASISARVPLLASSAALLRYVVSARAGRKWRVGMQKSR